VGATLDQPAGPLVLPPGRRLALATEGQPAQFPRGRHVIGSQQPDFVAHPDILPCARERVQGEPAHVPR